MRNTILSMLKRIEKEEEIQILYAVESGSRAWGFASHNSDYDVRFIYKCEIKDYLRLKPPRDVIERPIVDEMDINGWDLYKALGLFQKSNPPLLEWLFSPIVYLEESPLIQSLREHAQRNISLRRLAYHYFHMANGNYNDFILTRDMVRLKKYIYILRALVCLRWVEQRRTPPPTSIWHVLDDISLEEKVHTKIVDLLELKKKGDERNNSNRDPLLDTFIEKELARVKTEVLSDLPDQWIDEDELNEWIWRS